MMSTIQRATTPVGTLSRPQKSGPAAALAGALLAAVLAAVAVAGIIP